MSREIKQACNHLHLALTGLKPAFRQALLGGHAADVVIEDKACRQDWQWSAMREVHGWLVNRDVQTATVIPVPSHFNVLQTYINQVTGFDM